MQHVKKTKNDNSEPYFPRVLSFLLELTILLVLVLAELCSGMADGMVNIILLSM